MIFLDIRKGEVFELQTRTPRIAPKRGGFDPDGNAWFGGAGGALVKIDAKTHQLSEYRPPTPGVSFYECLPDKNGEIWAGELYAGRIVRYNPKTDRWTEYVLPEPVSHDRRTWIDNSTDAGHASGTSTTTASWCACSRWSSGPHGGANCCRRAAARPLGGNEPSGSGPPIFGACRREG